MLRTSLRLTVSIWKTLHSLRIAWVNTDMKVGVRVADVRKKLLLLPHRSDEISRNPSLVALIFTVLSTGKLHLHR